MANESAVKARYRDGLFGFIGKRPFIAMLKTFLLPHRDCSNHRRKHSATIFVPRLDLRTCQKEQPLFAVVGVQALGYLI
jgi:hypothetical protein